ncbi:dopamine N-acetyltransferase [Drosophila busckii]|uniref:dopamine N-acetyltransferase n=1 Tax=Drosophila busckii TaxID=30019 RepID=UPI001433330E|nr:dopamine N-acetyltransferase [Drosophila busckii]
MKHFDTKDGIHIRFMDMADYEQVKIFLRNHYYNAEPLAASSDEELREVKAEVQSVLKYIKQGISLVAIDETDSEERIVGCTVAATMHAGDYSRRLKESPDDAEHSDWRSTIELFDKVIAEGNPFERYGVNKLLLFDMIAVDARMRGKGIGARLATAQMELGRKQGFEVMVAICTSFYSARQLSGLGMECIYELAYADYLDANGSVLFELPAPHTHIRLLAIGL